jgi:hypothetical protein
MNHLILKTKRNTSTSRIIMTPKDIITDVENAYHLLINPKYYPHPNGMLYHIVIQNTKTNKAETLNFQLTNLLFNRINKETSSTSFYLNYLFVLEYPEALSIGLELPTNIDLHAHIAINTNIPEPDLEITIKEKLPPHFSLFIENITDRNDKPNLIHYFTKQATINYFLTDKHYNYKILFNSPQALK